MSEYALQVKRIPYALLLRLLGAGRPLLDVVRMLQRVVNSLMSNPYMADMVRFLFLGTLVEAGRKLGERAIQKITESFVVTASFTQGDFAHDWVSDYLEYHNFWGRSRAFRVLARDPARVRGGKVDHEGNGDSGDGRADAVYEPSPQAPELLRWRGYWISVAKTAGTHNDYDTGEELGGSLTLTVYNRNRQILQDLVQEAREHYLTSTKPPRRVDPKSDPSGCVLTAHFIQGDASYNWVLSMLQSQDLLKHATEVSVTTKQYEAAWSTTNSTAVDVGKQHVRFTPPEDARQLFKWNGHWVQATYKPGPSYRGSEEGGRISLVVHNSKQNILVDLIEAARQHYLERASTKVTVHMTENYYGWNKTMVKSQRPLDTLILPDGVKERLLADAREFLDSEQWYALTGVPHRRGYLLHGEPGTGKSSTIHALAGELGLEVYFLSLAAPGITDASMATLVSDTPSHCIILLEDIDCAFPSRDPDDDDDDDEEEEEDERRAAIAAHEEKSKGKGKGKGKDVEIKVKAKGKDGGEVRGGKRVRERQMLPPRSNVTLAGLLNVLDGVTSEEGRIVFATTNHIENLDPALIRAGRMDVKVQYSLASRSQTKQTFLRFYPVGGHVFKSSSSTPAQPLSSTPTLTSDLMSASIPTSEPSPSSSMIQIAENKSRRDHHGLTEADLDVLAERFSDAVAPATYSIAQIQGYLLTRKNNPVSAVEDVDDWLEDQRKEKEHIADAKKKRKREAKKREEERRMMWMAQQMQGAVEVGDGNEEMRKGESKEVEDENATLDDVGAGADAVTEEVTAALETPTDTNAAPEEENVANDDLQVTHMTGHILDDIPEETEEELRPNPEE